MYRELFLQGGPAHCYIMTHGEDGRVATMTSLHDEYRDFEWGYNGSGPHNLAYAMLKEYFDKGTADRYFRSFVNVVVSNVPIEMPLWYYTDKQMDGFLADAKRLGYTL